MESKLSHMSTTLQLKEALTAIIPISDAAGRLDKLRMTLSIGIKSNINFIIVHDVRDELTGFELNEIISELNSANIIFLEGNFGSPGAARNAGINLAETPWLTFWDCDDIPMVNLFVEMTNLATIAGVEVAVGGFSIISDYDQKVLATQAVNSLLFDNFKKISQKPGVWRFIFRSQLIVHSAFPELSMAEDQVFLARLALVDRSVLFFEKCVYKYFVGGFFHLTKNRSAIKDILLAANEMNILMRKGSTSNKHFCEELFLRQLISALKHGNLETQLISFFKLVRFGLIYPMNLIAIIRRIIKY